ncbi:MAG: starch phosphorylase [Candidatus Nanohaloarchaea archaeon]|jgi:starch phosphorylase
MSRSVAYFSMEIGITPEIKTFSGGLGILAGDTLKAAADHGLDFTAVTMLYRDGYFKQVIEDQKQEEFKQDWNYQEILEDTGKTVHVNLRGSDIEVKIWKYTWKGAKGEIDIYFLDTGLESNKEGDQQLTSQLYMGGQETRLCQEAILGIGGTRALQELEIDVDFFHMNEGHSSLLTTEAEGEKVFTTHTPVAAGHDTFSRELAEKVLPEPTLDRLDFGNTLNMTELALKHSKYCNGVSDKHAEVSRKMFPEYEFDAVTNGVHSATWTAEPYQRLYNDNISKWRIDPARLTKVAGISDSSIWQAKKSCKEELAKRVEENTGKKLDENVFTIGFARRSTGYKRPTLIFKDVERLEELANTYNGLQIVFGGKAHPDDQHGKELIGQVLKYSEMLENVDVYFIEDYSMEDSLYMLAGSDLWLNNPIRGKEASGTSGMKAAHNGTPQLSTPDGWWLEGHIKDITGWNIGEDYVEGEDEDRVDSVSMYEKLAHILATYHNDRKQWIKIMKHCITLNASHFNADRMLKEYLAKAYT